MTGRPARRPPGGRTFGGRVSGGRTFGGRVSGGRTFGGRGGGPVTGDSWQAPAARAPAGALSARPVFGLPDRRPATRLPSPPGPVTAHTRMGGGSPVTAAGPCRTLTGFPILPARGRAPHN